MRPKALLVIILLLGMAVSAMAQDLNSMLDLLPTLKDFEAMRSSSADPNWKNGNGDARPIQPGETLTIADLKGPGRIAHIWFTISDPERYYGKKLVLRVYWDGEKSPSVESPINDFFCQGHGMDILVNSLPFRVSSNGRGRNCYFPMPFRKSARIEVANEGKEGCNALYYYIDWHKLDSLPADTAYFHAKYRQEFPCRKGSDYLILFARGRGHYVGCNLSVRQREPSWWGEGDDRFYIDGETVPRLNGTGSEDYFCDGWGFRQFDGLFYGVPLMEGNDTYDRTTVYRFHITDPVPFKKDLRLTIEHKGAGTLLDGNWTGFKERFDDFSSVAYWYQLEPHVDFAKLPSTEERLYANDTSAIEGESLLGSAADKSALQVQDLGGGWSRGQQLFFTPSDENAILTLSLPVRKTGLYDVRVHLTKSWDYGIYQAYLDGKAVGKPADIYSPEVVLAPVVKLGKRDLSSGEHTLEFRCVGKNEAAKGFFFGLDLIELIPAM